ncbi:hypothetical protein EVAR_32420_1 [Eumeta japonica]|uniref:Uncharacterized protein n=1 Tax=Eumeta variegata TaxID=151549 RepID=A0A4C1VK53_EUMVA|nr:hypothetical protein EVAR_32420_1 [Eumeta japonica]
MGRNSLTEFLKLWRRSAQQKMPSAWAMPVATSQRTRKQLTAQPFWLLLTSCWNGGCKKPWKAVPTSKNKQQKQAKVRRRGVAAVYVSDLCQRNPNTIRGGICKV